MTEAEEVCPHCGGRGYTTEQGYNFQNELTELEFKCECQIKDIPYEDDIDFNEEE